MGDGIRGQGTDDDPLRKDLLSTVSSVKKKLVENIQTAANGKKVSIFPLRKKENFYSLLSFIRKDGICCSAIPSRLLLHLSKCNF